MQQCRATRRFSSVGANPMAQWLEDFAKRHPERFAEASSSTPSAPVESGAALAQRAGASIMQPMDGLPTLKPARELTAPATRMTTLPNGVRVISIDTFCGVCSVGAFVDAGSRHETAANWGVGSVLEKLAFKGGASGEGGRSPVEVAALMERHGINPSTMSSREHISFQLEAQREHMPVIVDLLAETCLDPALRETDLAEARTVLDFEEQDREYMPEEIVTELIHEAAYGKTSQLGHAQLCSAQRAQEITLPLLREFSSAHFTGDNIVISAAGVDHDELVIEAEKHFGAAAAGKDPQRDEIDEGKYVGGHVFVDAAPAQMAVSSAHVHAPPAMCHVALGFESSGWSNDELVPMCVMSTLLGGGSSFSAGGPGKGMYSRLYLEVLNRHYWVESARAHPAMYDTTGMFYIHGTAEPANAHDLVSVLVEQFANCALKPPSAIETSRAKNQLKSSVLMNLESRQIMCEDLGRQVLTYGRRKSEEEVCERIDAVTPEELQQVSYGMVMRAPLSLVAYGDVSRLQPYEFYDGFFEERFRQKSA